jgi:hypothetical protein
MRYRLGFTILVCLTILGGCERGESQQTAAPPVRPATRAAPTTAPSTHPMTATATTMPAAAVPSIITIDYQRVDFPPAKLMLEKKDGEQLTAVLHSDDPPQAIEENYAGNSFYLEMPLEIGDASELGTASWKFVAPTSDRVDSPTGIFVDGMRQQLQPLRVQVEFDGAPPDVTVYVAGQFMLFDGKDPNALGREVMVSARLHPVMESK